MGRFGQATRAFAAGATLSLLTGFSVASAQESSAPATTPEPSWHPSSTLNVTGGALFMPSSEESKWKERQPMHFQVQQTYTVAEPMGELGLGAGLTYDAAGGKASRTVAGKKEPESTSYSLYGIGLGIVADYRLTLTPHPVVAPRFAVFGGVSLQSQKTLQADYTAKSEQFYKPIAGARAHVELSLLALNPGERGSVAFGYGVEDFILSAGTTYLLDPSPRRSYKVTGYTIEGGLGFLFP